MPTEPLRVLERHSFDKSFDPTDNLVAFELRLWSEHTDPKGNTWQQYATHAIGKAGEAFWGHYFNGFVHNALPTHEANKAALLEAQRDFHSRIAAEWERLADRRIAMLHHG